MIVAVAGFLGWRMTRSEDPFDAYCAEVEEQQVALGGELSSGGAATGLIIALPAFELLAEMAPDDIAEDWQTVIERIQTLVDAIDAAGADPATYQRDDPPPRWTARSARPSTRPPCAVWPRTPRRRSPA